ncbi:hypothetical protein JW948_12265 [bacterium]|nr:hypothetical protein [bacterium]
MKRRKTIYLDVMNHAIVIIFIMLIFVFISLGITNMPKIFWLAVSQFFIAAILALYLLIYGLLNNNFGKKYIYFDDTGLELKCRYFEDKVFLHWESIEKITVQHRDIRIILGSEEQKTVRIKCPYEKCNEIQEAFFEFAESKNVKIE